MLEFAGALSLIFLPLAFVPGAVRPGLNTLAVSHGADPFAFVDGPALESVRLTGFSHPVLFWNPLDYLLTVPVVEVFEGSHVATVLVIRLIRIHFIEFKKKN